MPKFRVFSSDNIELAPCNTDRAHNLVRKKKACFAVIDEDEIVIILNKSSKQTLAKEVVENE